jgi:hypothetical protein
LDVCFIGDYYEGSIDLSSTPPDLKRLFEEYEEVVENQTFSLLDTIEEKIGAIRLKVAFDDGSELDIEDLQVFPSRLAISFAVRQPVLTRSSPKISTFTPPA